MKYSELKKIIENAYVDLSKLNIGDTKIDPDTGKKIYVYPNRRPKKSPLG
jgi:hypothetical protein